METAIETGYFPLAIVGADASPPPFAWNDWYAGVGGRTVLVPEVNEILQEIYQVQYPRCFGETARSRVEFADESAAAAAIKATAKQLGADLVGICEIEPSDIYRGKSVEHRFAIALGMRMKWRAFQTVPSQESAIECLRVYQELGEVVIALADYIRSLGWDCTVEHPIGDTDVLHVPIALKAGFGELGRHGSIINPELGPLFRMGCVLTSLPMALDHPIDAGIAKFCDKCRACRIYCPADAIPDDRNSEAGQDHLGYDRYKVDTGKCFPYFAKHYYCSICLPVCVYNHKEWARDFDGFSTKLFPEVVMNVPPAPVDTIPAEKRHTYPKIKRAP